MIIFQVLQVLTPNFHSNSVVPYLTLNIQYIALSMMRQLSQSRIPPQVSNFLLSEIKIMMKAIKLKQFFFCLQVEQVSYRQKLTSSASQPKCMQWEGSIIN